MIENATKFYSGYAQVQQKNYWEERTLNNTFVYDETLRKKILQHPEIINTIPRLESFALASSGKLSRGAAVIGIEPTNEIQLTNFDRFIKHGAYLEANDNSVVIGEGLSRYLEIDLTDNDASNDTIILIGQGYHGIMAAGKYLVKGIFQFPIPDVNKAMIFMPLKEAQHLYGCYDQVTSVILNLQEMEVTEAVVNKIQHQLDTTNHRVMSWIDMNPQIIQVINADKAGDLIVQIIIYTIISFGIFGTILMMTVERMYEFGVLLAIGMKRVKIAIMIWLESLMIGLIGLIAGILVSIPLVLYFKYNPIKLGEGLKEASEKFGLEPIIPTAFKLDIFLSQTWVVLIIVTILSIYPLLIVSRMKAVKAMKN